MLLAAGCWPLLLASAFSWLLLLATSDCSWLAPGCSWLLALLSVTVAVIGLLADWFAVWQVVACQLALGIQVASCRYLPQAVLQGHPWHCLWEYILSLFTLVWLSRDILGICLGPHLVAIYTCLALLGCPWEVLMASCLAAALSHIGKQS